MRALFDVNVLLALFDREHVHHGRAATWWKTWRSQGWASCPLTENGFVRVISGGGYANPLSTGEAMRILNDQIKLGDHAFWPDSISISDAAVFNDAYILGPRQITDVYLLALAVKHGGRLVTLDTAVPLAAVRGAEPRHLVVPP